MAGVDSSTASFLKHLAVTCVPTVLLASSNILDFQSEAIVMRISGVFLDRSS
jgi:hypothetical protein